MTFSVVRPTLPLLLIAVALLQVLALPVSLSAKSQPFKPLRINCGGGDVRDRVTGQIWHSDKNYAVHGRKYRFSEKFITKDLKSPAPQAVLESVRRSGVSFRIKQVPDGLYQLRLHFVDGKKEAVRRMDFWVEGVQVIQNLSPREAAGGHNRGYIFEGIVEVKDGNGLSIRGSRGHGDDVFVSAIEILPAPAGSVPTPPAMASPQPPPDLLAQLRTFAGGPARLVWTRTDVEEDFYQKGDHGVLYGMDTEDGKGERIILPEVRSYAMPLLTPDGKKIVFTDQTDRKCYEVNFDGTGLRPLVPGYASDIWRDPQTGITWLYVRSGWRNTKSPILRYRLDDLSHEELVWNKSPTGQPQSSWFQLSGDGQLASDGFPWPNCGLADVAGGDFQVMGKGCWPGVAPDSSHRSFYFLGEHTAMQFHDRPDAAGRRINLATVPGWTGRKVYHPRWTNHVRFLTVTAPQWMPETELYIGRFDEGFTEIESWFRVTYNDTADFFGDVWFQSASSVRPTPEPGPTSPDHGLIARSSPGATPGLVYVWENERAKNAVTDEDGKVLRTWAARFEGETRPDRWYGAVIRQGALTPDEEAGAAVSQALDRTGAFTLSLALAPALPSGRPANGTIVWLGAGPRNGRVVLSEHGRSLSLALTPAKGSPVEVDLGEIQPGSRSEWTITYDGQRLISYRDGLVVLTTPVTVDLRGLKASLLQFGRDPAGTQPWQGTLDQIHFYDRPLSGPEIATLHEQGASAREKRTPAPQVVVEAELVHASEPDEPETIAPYVRSLGENVYKVTKVLSGTLSETDVVVLQWVVLGGRILGSAARTEGQTYRLVLEPVASHPQLDGEHRSTDVFEPAMPVFYDVDS